MEKWRIKNFGQRKVAKMPLGAEIFLRRNFIPLLIKTPTLDKVPFFEKFGKQVSLFFEILENLSSLK